MKANKNDSNKQLFTLENLLNSENLFSSNTPVDDKFEKQNIQPHEHRKHKEGTLLKYLLGVFFMNWQHCPDFTIKK